mgnify:CR=1 FL=1
MVSRSMNFLRKNAKAVLVFMGVVCMVTFVVGPYLLDLFAGRGRPAIDNPVVVTWTKGKVRSDELRRMRFHHQLAYQFLQQVVVTAIQRGGKPTLYGQPIRLDQSFDVGIPADNSDEALVQTMVLAEEARRRGIVVDRAAVKEFLRQLSFPELNEGDWQEIAQELVRDKNVTVNQLFDHLAYELRAQRMRVLAMTGLTAPRVGPIVPPAQAWELFNRLNRRVTIEAYPVEVLPLISQVREEPTEAEVLALFEQGRYRDPDPTLDEPAFHKPHKLAFTYLKVPFAPFLEEAKKQITQEQIEQAYQEDISQGRHKVLELPGEKPSTEQPSTEQPTTEKPSADQPATEKPTTEKPSSDTPAGDKPAGDKPAGEPPADKPASADKPAEKAAPAAPSSPTAPPSAPSDKTPDAPSRSGAPGTPSDKPAEKEKPSDEPTGSAEAPGCGGDEDLTAALASSDPSEPSLDEQKSATPPTNEALSGSHKKAEKPEKKGGDTRAADKPAVDKPLENKTTVDKPASDKPAEETPPTDKPNADKPATAQQPATEKPAENRSENKPASPPSEPTAQPAAPDKTAEPSPKPAAEPKFKPLSEVREEIVLRLARPIAEEARKKAVAEVMSAIEAYGKKYRRYHDVKSVRKTADIADPGRLDLAPLAAKYGFEIGTTPLVDRFEVAEYEIGQKVQQLDMAAVRMGQFRMLSFADLAFGVDEPLYRPQEVPSVEADVSYIFFRTAEEKPADVTLQEVRPQVIAFWKKRRALELAKAEARKLIDKLAAQGAGAGLASVVPDPSRVVVTPPFSWMTTPHFGFGMPELSPVPGIDLAGQEFMQSVFALQPGQAGLAPNQPRTKVYVVRVLGQEPDEETLRQRFLESGYNNFVLMLAQLEARQAAVNWYRGLEQQYQVKWLRPPQDVQRM